MFPRTIDLQKRQHETKSPASWQNRTEKIAFFRGLRPKEEAVGAESRALSAGRSEF